MTAAEAGTRGTHGAHGVLGAADGPGWPALLALPVGVVLLGLPSLRASFQYDDWHVIVHDPGVQSLAAWWQAMPGIRPVLKLSYALGWSAGGGVAAFRASNLLLHGANALLLALLLARRAQAMALPLAAAWLGAALFALHPVQVESVTYVSGRSGALAACGMLAALLCRERARDGSRNGSSLGSRAWLAGAAGCYLLALGSKETAIATPLLAWVLEATGDARAPRTRWPGWLAWAAPAIAFALLALAWPPYRQLLAAGPPLHPLGPRLLAQGQGLDYLALQLLRPWHQDIDPRFAPAGAGTAVALAAWLAAAVAAIAARRRHPQAAFALLWLLACLAPMLVNLRRPDAANDRQLYLALAGPAWGLAVLLLRAPRPFARALAASLLAVLAACTLARNRDYATEVTLWRATLAASPANARAANNLGMALALACQPGPAREAFLRAAALAPDDPRPRLNLRLLAAGQLREPGRPGGPPPPRCDAPPADHAE